MLPGNTLVPILDIASDHHIDPAVMLRSDILAYFSTATETPLPQIPRSLVVWRNPDDSMAPSLAKGSLMIIDHTETEWNDGLYLVERGDQQVARRVQISSDGTILLRCDNPAWPAELMGATQCAGVRIVGRIVMELKGPN
jgi:hypothetical protein